MSSFQVLAVLEDDPRQLWPTLTTAVDLAAAESGSVTLAKTAEADMTYIMLNPLVFGGFYMPPSLERELEAARLLSEAATVVPDWLSPTTIMLGRDTQDCLRALIRESRYDAVVATPTLFGRAPRLARDMRKTGVAVVSIDPPRAHSSSARASRGSFALLRARGTAK